MSVYFLPCLILYYFITYASYWQKSYAYPSLLKWSIIIFWISSHIILHLFFYIFFKILPLIGALAEKLTLCTEATNIRDLAAGMYGLQGMTSTPMEMKQLIAAIGMKLSETDEVDAVSVGNCMYSLQVRY